MWVNIIKPSFKPDLNQVTGHRHTFVNFKTFEERLIDALTDRYKYKYIHKHKLECQKPIKMSLMSIYLYIYIWVFA